MSSVTTALKSQVSKLSKNINQPNEIELNLETDFYAFRPKQLQTESSCHYQLFLSFLKERNFNKLSHTIRLDYKKTVSKRQLFYLANEHKWRERAIEYDNEINFRTLQETSVAIQNAKKDQMDILVELMGTVNNAMRTFQNQILTDLNVFHTYIDPQDDAKIKRMTATMKVFKDFVYISSKLQNMIRESGAEDFNVLDYIEKHKPELTQEEILDLDFESEEERKYKEYMKIKEEELSNKTVQNSAEIGNPSLGKVMQNSEEVGNPTLPSPQSREGKRNENIVQNSAKIENPSPVIIYNHPTKKSIGEGVRQKNDNIDDIFDESTENNNEQFDFSKLSKNKNISEDDKVSLLLKLGIIGETEEEEEARLNEELRKQGLL